MAHFDFEISDSTRTANSLLWTGVIDAETIETARAFVAAEVQPSICRETGLPGSLLRVHVTQIVPHRAPDYVA